MACIQQGQFVQSPLAVASEGQLPPHLCCLQKMVSKEQSQKMVWNCVLETEQASLQVLWLAL